MENLEILKNSEIIKTQNMLALNEFKRNYNKSESYRVLEELAIRDEVRGEHDVDLSDELMEVSNTVRDLQVKLQNAMPEYIVKVSPIGYITVSQEEAVPEGANYKSYIQIASSGPTVKLPYAYVMGKKVGKRHMEEVLRNYSYLLK